MVEFSLIKVLAPGAAQQVSTNFPLYKGTVLEDILRYELQREVARVAKLGQAALKSAVPIRSHLLRNSIVTTALSPYAQQVGIRDAQRSGGLPGVAGPRRGSSKPTAISNHHLAEILDAGVSEASPADRTESFVRSSRRTGRREQDLYLHRSQRAAAIAPFTNIPSTARGESTANWISNAQQSLIEYLKIDKGDGF